MMKRLLVLLALAGGLIAHADAQTYQLPSTDTSAAAGFGGTKWRPLFFGNAGTGNVWKFNRIFCGEATFSSGDAGPVTTKDWLETLLANTTGVAQFACVDTTGQLGVLGASRSSDFRAAIGGATGGAQGITGFGNNDDTTGSPIALGVNGIGRRASGVGGVTLGYQADMNNAGSVVDIEPSVGFTGGANMAALATSGAYTSLGTANTSAAYVVAIGRVGGPVHRKGLVEISGSLDTSIGAGGGGIAADFFRGMSIRWRNSTPTTDAEIWGNASGLVLNNAAATVDASGNIATTANLTGANLVSTNTFFTQAPATLTGTSGTTTSTTQIINASGAFTLTLPNPVTFPGRWLYIKSIAAQTITSASSNVVPRSTATAGTAILASGAGNWTALQSDGTNWIAMMGTP